MIDQSNLYEYKELKWTKLRKYVVTN